MSRRTDRIGMPVLNVNWRWSAPMPPRRRPPTRRSSLGGRRDGRAELPDDGDLPRIPETAAGNRDHMGTTRTHESPTQGVVDPNGRLHDSPNVTGSLGLPDLGVRQSHLTIVALAQWLGEHLAAHPGPSCTSLAPMPADSIPSPRRQSLFAAACCCGSGLERAAGRRR
ncbi:MAG: hypothetical protein R2705_05980 [Ilumatobacteraceae bacterium]